MPQTCDIERKPGGAPVATNQQRREAAKRKLERQLERRAEKKKRQRRVGAAVVGVAVLVVAGVVVWIVSSNGSSDNPAAAQSSTPPQVFPELSYGRGILAMAKTSAPNSGGSQFFMVYGDAQLPPNYEVFGSITDAGLQVLDKVAKAGIKNPGSDGTGAPNIEVKFTGVTVN